MASAQITDSAHVRSNRTVTLEGGVRPPVAPIGTSTRLADRWFIFVRAIDSSFSAAVASVRAFRTPAPVGGAPRSSSVGPGRWGVAFLHGALRPVRALSHLRSATGFG